jgi:hypothetical protein
MHYSNSPLAIGDTILDLKNKHSCGAQECFSQCYYFFAQEFQPGMNKVIDRLR